MDKRYARQIAVPEIGKDGQLKLNQAKVFIIGCGALGSMVSMQLAGAGIGLIGIADYDNVEISNLQRQFFFTTRQTGIPKVEILAQRIKELNPATEVVIFKEMITGRKAEILFSDYDFIIDASDNPDTKEMTGKIAGKIGIPCCIGGVQNFSGQVTTFLSNDSRFEDYFGEADSQGFLPCSLAGVVGPAAALCASIQATEAIKFILGKGNLLSERLLTFNLLTDSFKVFKM